MSNWLVNKRGPFHLQLPETLITSSECLSPSLSLSIYIAPLPHSPSLLPLTSTTLPAKTRRLYAAVIPKKLHRDQPSFQIISPPTPLPSLYFSSHYLFLLYASIWKYGFVCPIVFKSLNELTITINV